MTCDIAIEVDVIHFVWSNQDNYSCGGYGSKNLLTGKFLPGITAIVTGLTVFFCYFFKSLEKGIVLISTILAPNHAAFGFFYNLSHPTSSAYSPGRLLSYR